MQNSDVTSVLGTILSPGILSASFLPLSKLSFSCFLSGLRLSQLSFLIPLFTFLPLTWPLPFQCQPLLSCSSVLSSSQTLLHSHLADDHSLLLYLSGILSLSHAPCHSAFGHLVISVALLTSHTCDRQMKLLQGQDHYSSPALGSWIRSDASDRDLGTQNGITSIVEQEVEVGSASRMTRAMSWPQKETHPLTGFEAVENHRTKLSLPGLTESSKTILWDQNGLLSGNRFLLCFVFSLGGNGEE